MYFKGHQWRKMRIKQDEDEDDAFDDDGCDDI